LRHAAPRDIPRSSQLSGDICWLVVIVRAWNVVVGINVVVIKLLL